jgi:hypothetical protein
LSVFVDQAAKDRCPSQPYLLFYQPDYWEKKLATDRTIPRLYDSFNWSGSVVPLQERRRCAAAPLSTIGALGTAAIPAALDALWTRGRT